MASSDRDNDEIRAASPDDDLIDGCKEMPDSYAFKFDLAIKGWLAVGQGCPVDQNAPRVWISDSRAGSLGMAGNLRTEATASAGDLAFLVGSGPNRAPSSARLSADTTGTFGLDGALRVSDALGIGAAPDASPGAGGRLVVQGDPAEPQQALQVWRTGHGAPRVAVDADGRLGVGTTAPRASLSVHGTFLTELSGTVKGYDNDTKLTGSRTRFQTELEPGATITIPKLHTGPTTFRVVSIKDDLELHLDAIPAVNFDDHHAFTDAPLLSVRDGIGSEWLHLNSAGTLTAGGGTVTMTSKGEVRATDLVGERAEIGHGGLTVLGDISIKKLVGQGASISDTGVVTATQFVGAGAVVTGMIVMWSGNASAVPTGWALCDGQQGTPDLRSRFLVGAGSQYQTGQNGPPDVHTHQVDIPSRGFPTTTNGAHVHGFPPPWYGNSAWAGSNRSILDTRNTDPRNLTTQPNGDHSHAVTVSYTPFQTGSSSGENRPNWFALAFIMKL